MLTEYYNYHNNTIQYLNITCQQNSVKNQAISQRTSYFLNNGGGKIRLSVSPDRKTFLFSGPAPGTTNTDLMLIENFR
jgi:hypothetical protein